MTRVFAGFAALFVILLLAVRFVYGGGKPFPAQPIAADNVAAALEPVFEYAEPVGGLAVDGADVYFTVHSAARPAGNRLLRLRDGVALPFPDGAAQQRVLDTPLGLALDDRGTLWVIDHGHHGRSNARLLAFDTATGALVHEHEFSRDIAPVGSMPSALAVTGDGASVFVADTSVLRRRPALIAYTPATGVARRLLERAPALSSQGYVMRAGDRDMRFFGGFVTLKPGLAGLALDAGERWLYLAAASNDGVYRVAVEMLEDPSVAATTLAGAVQRFGDKPLSDGIAAAPHGSLFVTDVAGSGVIRIGQDRRPRAHAAGGGLRWPGPLSVTDDGTVWVGDSGLPAFLFRGDAAVSAGAPYAIYRIRTER